MEHVAAHGVSPEKVEQVFWRIPQVRRLRLERYVAVGQTQEITFIAAASLPYLMRGFS